MAETPTRADRLKYWQDVIDRGRGIEPRQCSHMWRHTTYGSRDRARNGTVCVICGKKL